ncbi:TPA: small subunit of terminase [Enterococcus faecalis]|nr:MULTISPECIES: phage terminase small subunit [Enterococcus]ETJ09401.1 MAG: Terminase [Enterococcus faecalis DORA_14]DAP21048.1 MAG TPA: Small Terminase [Caudoviricetes sp.]HAP3747712.1 small subunit of terminase [Enterococcus faecalis TDR28]HAP3753506.1 small subunit of terminase [Enterococcus faecalis TDR22]HAP3756512.1 small subunit of terminase [Enterococcus faecalis TDR13]HAP3759481.1 small subunit of terminase [Enterococcus faecalis TDR7]HAP3770619.1 small subunit of terminase [Entero
MARKRDPRRDQAKEIWLKSNGKKVLKELANELNVSDSQIRKWKSIDKWADELKGNVTNSKSNVTNKGGAPPGNKNAIGNKGNKTASPPKRNKNAVKTGEYETIFADMLSDEEKDIYSTMNDDPFFILEEEIRILKIRQYRMLKRIKDAEVDLNDEEVERLQQLRKVKEPSVIDGKMVTVKREVLKDVQVTRKTFRKLDDILAIEEALTRISNQLTKAIKQQNALLANDAKLQLLKVQTEKVKASLDATNGDMDMPVFIDDISGDEYE